MANLFNKNKEHRGIMPIGDGEVLSIGAQTNGTYYQSYNVSYSTNWFGGKRPIQFSVGAYYSKSTDVSSNYYNSAAMYNYQSYLYGYGSSYYNNYENYYDPDKYIQMVGVSLGWGKRLRWPDDYFTLSVQLAYQRYMMKNWSYMLMTNGNANNLNLTIALNRTSTDNQLFPRRGSPWLRQVSTLLHHGVRSTTRTTRILPTILSRQPILLSSRRSTDGLNTISGSSRQRLILHSQRVRSASY